MKKYYRFAYFILVLISAVFSFVSCDVEGDSSGTGYGSDFCNVVISESGKYTLYADAGHVLLPNEQSQKSIKDAFGTKMERLLITYNYNIKSVELGPDSMTYVKDATVLSGQIIPVEKIMTREAAEQQNLLVADSLFSMNSIQNMHLKNGYLTLSALAPVSVVNGKGIYPTMTMVIDGVEKAENSKNAVIKLHLCYNRHTEPSSDNKNVMELYASFPVRDLLGKIQGCTTAKVIVRVEGQEAVSFATDARQADFKLPY